MPKIIELRENRKFISKNFSGYKLSLDRMPMFQQQLSKAPFTSKLNNAQYSLLHVELFSMQNLLVSDSWARKLAFYVNESQEIQRSYYNGNYGRAEALQTVFRFVGADVDARICGDYNYSMRFVSEKYCILCDGIQTIFLFDTGDRLKATEWKVIMKTRIELPEQRRNFTIYDSRLDIVQDKKVISLILGRIEDLDDGHSMQLYWSKLYFEESSWTFDIVDIILGKGSLYYCAFEPRGKSLIICSNNDFDFQSNVNAKLKAAKNASENLNDESKATKMQYDFTWEQTVLDATIKFPVIVGKEKCDYDVKNSAEKLFVKCGERVLMDNELYEKINLELTWTVENNCLKVTLIKQSPLLWHSLFPNDGGPEESNLTPNNNGFDATQKPIANLAAPIEDCDFPIDSMDDEIFIDRLHLATKEKTHRAIIGATPPLFSTNLRAGFPPALALRQDVDASLWVQNLSGTYDQEWSLHHTGNINAFGYVLASKTQKKFTDCAPDLNYAVVCESQRHAFLYKAKYDTAEGLRNRNGPPVDVGKQYLITLEDAGEILGLTTDNDVVVLLTTKCLMYFQII